MPECLDDYVSEDNPVRAIEALVEQLDLKVQGFAGAEPKATGRPGSMSGFLCKPAVVTYSAFRQVSKHSSHSNDCLPETSTGSSWPGAAVDDSI